MSLTHQPQAIVIGAGLSGLAAARAIRKRGIPVTILEASAQVADPWRARHPQLRLNIHRHFAQLPGRAMTRDDGTFVRRDTVVKYLEDYATDLDAAIAFNTRVTAVHRNASGWRVVTDKGDYHCAHLVIATGRERIATIPIWPGLSDFGGEVLHSADLGDVSRYDGRKVLVIGAGNSGTDVLNHLSRGDPAKVWVSVRHGPSILPTRVFGFPLHRLARLFALFPAWALDPTFNAMQRLVFGNLRRFGLRRHKRGGGTRMLRDGITFALDDGFVAALKSGRIKAVAETVGFGSETVKLADGQRINPDAVICATGYRTGLAAWLGDTGALDARGYPRHPMGEADPDNPGLWFTGFKPVFTGFFHAAGVSAERIAKQVEMSVMPSGQRDGSAALHPQRRLGRT